MTRALLALVAFLLPAAATAGPVSKWDDRKPDFDYVSRVNMFDVERCIFDAGGWQPPIVMRQPDRPDRVTLLYVDDTGSAGRLDLVTREGMTYIKGWKVPKAITTCAPPMAPNG